MAGTPHEAVIFDLEWTAWEDSKAAQWGRDWEHREVIQFGAVRIDRATARAVAAFSCLVKPRVNPELSDFIIDLTGITQADIDREGVPFAAALTQFLDFTGDAPLGCYGIDGTVLIENLVLYGLEDRFTLPGARNLGPWMRTFGVPPVNSGRLAQALGLPLPDGPGEHDALYDCQSIAVTLAYLRAERGAGDPFERPVDHGVHPPPDEEANP